MCVCVFVCVRCVCACVCACVCGSVVPEATVVASGTTLPHMRPRSKYNQQQTVNVLFSNWVKESSH